MERYTRLVADAAPQVEATDRTVKYTFSTPAVGRDQHTVASDAWQLTNFLRNPVFLWAHDDTLPPIGRVVEIGDVNGILRGTVEYAAAELNPFADTIYQLVRAKYLNAVSTSWQPLDWSISRDKTRPGGVDFTKVDLLEISQVPIPALATALAGARGINLKPLQDWTSRALDTRRYRAMRRQDLEAIHRAASGARLLTLVRRPRSYEDPARAELRERRARLREIEDRGDRTERGRRLRAGEAAHYGSADRTQLKTAQIHHERALKHQRALSVHHEGLGDQIEQLRTIHERMTQTLSEIGERSAASKMSRHFASLDRCTRAMNDICEDATDTTDNLGHSLGKATECVSNVLDANEKFEPAEAQE